MSDAASSKPREAPSSSTNSSLHSPGSVGFSSTPVTPVVVRDAHARVRHNDRNKKPRGAANGKDNAHGDNDDDDSDRSEDAGDESDSDSDHGARSAVSRAPRADAEKRDTKTSVTAKETKTPLPNGVRRKPASPEPYHSDNGSETSSQDATDDEMSGRGRGGQVASAPLPPNPSTSTVGSGPPGADAARDRNSSMTLPSLSRAAMIHMNRSRDNGENQNQMTPPATTGRPSAKRSDEQSARAYAAASMNGRGGERSSLGGDSERRRDRSRSRSRERQERSGGSGRWNDANANTNQHKDNSHRGGGGGDDAGSHSSGDGQDSQHGDDPASPGGSHDVRIMFHGREIYADDLLGLRVAKTFVGHGRFLGQVVKFDEPMSLYTIVYADGDAEELSIENTIQILIQDEIERADPSVPAISSANRNERVPDSPTGSNDTPVSSTATNAVPIVPLNGSAAPPPHNQPSTSSTSSSLTPAAAGDAPAYPPRRSSMAISEREAQFVVGLFESHALPVLLRQGWRVQSNSSGTEQRFVAPPGNFRGAGQVFPSALHVVERIAFDNELLSLCFPQNVHSAILSLFPDPASASASRKRSTSAVNPTDPSESEYDSKRVRGAPRDSYNVSGTAAAAPMVRANGPSGGGVGGGGGGTMLGSGSPGRGQDDRLVPPVSYRPQDRDRDRDRVGGRGDREAYYSNGPSMGMGPAGDRFPSGGGGGGGSREPSDNYRRGPSGGHPPPSRYSPETGEYHHHHRRLYSDAGQEWHDRDHMAGRGGPPPSSTGGGYMSGGGRGGGRPSAECDGTYYGNNERVLPRGSDGSGPRIRAAGGPPGGSGESPSVYARYREGRGPPPPSSGRYSPGLESFGSSRYPSSRGEQQAFGGGGGRSVGPGGPGGPNSGGRGFSMMDVERNVAGTGPSSIGGNGSGGGSGNGYERHHRMERGHSPHGDPAGPPPPMQQPYGHHQRTASNGSLPKPADEGRAR